MDPKILAIANSWPLWVVCAPVVILVIIQAGWFVSLCKKEATYIGYDPKNINQAVKSGMVTAIGPAIAGFVVMVSMMSSVGGPITWQRLSIIGAAQTELTAANLAAQGMGLTLGGEGYNLQALTLGFLAMAINGCGWLLMTAVCTGSMESVRQKIAGGDPRWLSVLSSAVTCGLFSNMVSQQLVNRSHGVKAAAITGFAIQFLLQKYVAPKYPAVKGYALGIALIFGMIVGAIVKPMHI